MLINELMKRKSNFYFYLYELLLFFIIKYFTKTNKLELNNFFLFLQRSEPIPFLHR
jgi:hypothetical protein